MKRSIQTTNHKTDRSFTSIAAHTVRSLLANACDVGASAATASPCWDRSTVCTAIFATSWAAENALCGARKQGIKLHAKSAYLEIQPRKNPNSLYKLITSSRTVIFCWNFDSLKIKIVWCDSFSPFTQLPRQKKMSPDFYPKNHKKLLEETSYQTEALRQCDQLDSTNPPPNSNNIKLHTKT